jgi:hypothetical protein
MWITSILGDGSLYWKRGNYSKQLGNYFNLEISEDVLKEDKETVRKFGPIKYC